MAYPSTLVRTKDWGTEILTDADLEGQLDLIINWLMAAMNHTTGHDHSTTNLGKLINIATGLTLASQAQGDLLYYSGSAWARLPAGTSGQYLKTQGASADPLWTSQGTPKGYIYGGVPSNNVSDPTNDLDISALVCRDSTNVYDITVAAMTKKVDAVWVAGDAAGAWDSGTVGSAKKVYIWAIGKSTDATAGDFLFSDQSASPTMPSTWDIKRLIGYRYWTGSAWMLFRTVGKGNYRKIYADESLATVLSSGTQTSFTDVNCGTYIDGSISKLAILNTFGSATGNNSVIRHYLRRNGSAATNGFMFGDAAQNHDTVGGALGDIVECPIDSSGIFEYKVAYLSLTIYLWGYDEEL